MEIKNKDSIILKCDSCGAEYNIPSSERDKPYRELGYYGFGKKLICNDCLNKLGGGVVYSK